MCAGTEPSLLMCDTNPVGESDCDHSEDAGVICDGMYVRYWVFMGSDPYWVCEDYDFYLRTMCWETHYEGGLTLPTEL